MRIAGIIAEYNPLHKGHIYHINATKAKGYDAVVCVLGGDFTQRGEPACFSKFARARMALLSGADVVISLPIDYSCACAGDFAFGGVSLLDSLGCVEAVSFGSETGMTDEICKLSEVLLNSGDEISSAMKSGIGYAAAVQKVLFEHADVCESGFVAGPNDILGIEYVSAIKKLGSSISPVAVKRQGALHDGTPVDGIASASFVRECILNGEDYAKHITDEVKNIIDCEISNGRSPVFTAAFDIAMLSRLRMLSAECIKNLPGVSEGLENRIYKAICTSSGVEETVKKCVSKRYTSARIRRILVSAALGLKKRPLPLEYIRVLGFTPLGKEVLSLAKKTSSLPIVTGYSHIKKLGEAASKAFSLECVATDFYALGYPKIGDKNREFTFKLINENGSSDSL